LVLETLCVSNYGGIAWFSFGKKGGNGSRGGVIR